jgi:hypothetical protein
LEEIFMEATILFVAVAALILLAVTSMRYGVDSRERLTSTERELARLGIVWGGSSATRKRQPDTTRRLKLSMPRLAVPRKCVSASCGA